MKRLLAVLVCVSVAAPGCGARASFLRTRTWPEMEAAAVSQTITRSYADGLPLGGRVRVSLKNGESFAATFMGVDGEAVRLQRRTRMPEPPVTVPFDDLAALSIEEGGIGVGKAIAIGAGVGAATFLGILALLMLTIDD